MAQEDFARNTMTIITFDQLEDEKPRRGRKPRTAVEQPPVEEIVRLPYNSVNGVPVENIEVVRRGRKPRTNADRPTDVEQKLEIIPLDKIRAKDGFNPRKVFDPEELEELRKSIEQYGVKQPIGLRPTDDGYDIIWGERRYRASLLAGKTTIPAMVSDVDDKLHLELALLENLMRVDLNPMEEAAGYAKLMAMGYKQAEIAAKVNRSQPAVANAIRLLKLPEVVRSQISDGNLSTSHALALAKYSDFPEIARAIGEIAVEQKIPSRDLEKGLPYGIILRLERENLMKRLNHSANFDWKKVCQQDCPFKAYRSISTTGSSETVCMRPAHYKELTEEFVRKEEQKHERAIKKVSKPGASLPTVEQLRKAVGGRVTILGKGTFEHAIPQGCSGECVCRRQATAGDNRTVECCIDSEGQLRKLEASESRRKNKEIREKNRALRDELAPRIDAVTEIDNRLLAIVLNHVFNGSYQLSQPMDVVAKRMGLPMTGSRLRTSRHHGPLLEVLEEMLAIEPQKLIRLAAEVLMMEEFHETERSPQPVKLMAWWLGEKKPRQKKAKKGASVITIDPAVAPIETLPPEEFIPAPAKPALVCDCCGRVYPGSGGFYNAGEECRNQLCLGHLRVQELQPIEALVNEEVANA